MNSNTTLTIFAALATMALVGATVTYVIIPADAQGANSGPFGQCKKEGFSDNACKKGNFP